VEVLSQGEIGLDLEIEETEKTFEGNALLRPRPCAVRPARSPSPTTRASWWIF
jgi:hypothetical protein